MISIFLTTVLLAVICTYGYGMIKSQKANAALDSGSHYGMCKSVNEEQLNEMERRSEFSVIGLMAGAGMIDSAYNVNFQMMDENARDMENTDSRFAEGTFPEAENEIAAQPEFFENLGYKGIRIGDTVSLDYRPDMKQKYEAREFKVSGFLKTRDNGMGQTMYAVYTSPAFYEAQYAPGERQYVVLFRLAESVPITYDDAEEVIGELVEKCGISKKRLSVNGGYLIWMLDPGLETIGICAFIAALVILFSVVVIYNIFQVGIVQKIQEYGKIRALGASKKQMRRLIYCEGMSLAACSIPAGVIVGFFVAWGSFGWLMKQGDEMVGVERIEVSVFSLPVLLLAAALAFVTVLLALRKPMKIVAAISPVDALRYQENTGSANAGIRKGRKRLSVLTMALANISANRRRTVMTIFTMGLSCVLFVIIANCVGNMDAGYEARKNVPYGQFQMELDYSLQDKAYPENNLDSILKNNPLNETLIQKIKQIDGVSQVRTMDILLASVNGRQGTAAVYDEDDFEWEKEQGAALGALDYQDGTEHDNLYYGWSLFMEDYGYALDQKLTVEFANGTDSRPADGVLKGSFGATPTDWVITRGMYERLGLSGDSTGWIWVDCGKKDVPAVRAELKTLLSDVEHVEFAAYEDALTNAKSAVRIMKTGCYLFLVVIGLIGFMNLANTMIMNIITKKQEYGVLQAVGMTNRQLSHSLQIQGMLFTAGTVFIAVLAGLPAGYGVFKYAKSNALIGINVYHIPFVEIAAMVAAVAALQLVLSFLLSRNLKKESLVERMRYQQ